MKNIDIMRKLLTMPQSESEHKEFKFTVFKANGHCGTKGCLAGDMPTLSKEWTWKLYPLGTDRPGLVLSENLSCTKDLELFFDLSYSIITSIFHNGPTNVASPTREQVQSHAIKVLKENGIDIL